MVMCSIIGLKRKNEEETIIKNHIKKCLIYHFFMGDIKNKEIKEKFKNDNSIMHMAGGAYIENVAKKILSNPETISNKLTEELFNKLIKYLLSENNSPYERKLENGKKKKDTRRKLKFHEKVLMFQYYKGKIPINMLENDFSIEHIMPNSSEWEGELDKDRTGNLIPIISIINTKRGNRHINSYKKEETGREFCKFIQDIIPNDDLYNAIIQHDTRPKILNNEKYNEMCEKNENIYCENFIKCLFNPALI